VNEFFERFKKKKQEPSILILIDLESLSRLSTG
jgi:hypothetical protein